MVNGVCFFLQHNSLSLMNLFEEDFEEGGDLMYKGGHRNSGNVIRGWGKLISLPCHEQITPSWL